MLRRFLPHRDEALRAVALVATRGEPMAAGLADLAVRHRLLGRRPRRAALALNAVRPERLPLLLRSRGEAARVDWAPFLLLAGVYLIAFGVIDAVQFNYITPKLRQIMFEWGTEGDWFFAAWTRYSAPAFLALLGVWILWLLALGAHRLLAGGPGRYQRGRLRLEDLLDARSESEIAAGIGSVWPRLAPRMDAAAAAGDTAAGVGGPW